MAARNYVVLVEKTTKVLEALGSGSRQLKEIAAAVGIGKSGAFRILYTLKQLGYVEQPDSAGAYRLTLKLLSVARGSVPAASLPMVARPWLVRLRDILGESAWLAELRGDKVVLVDAAETAHRLRLSLDVGDLCPFHASALGKAIAAHLPPEEWERLERDLHCERYTPYTIVSKPALRAELERVRKLGYAVNNEETIEGAFVAGAPVFDALGNVVAALSVTAPTARCGPAKQRAMIRTVVSFAAGLSQELRSLRFQARDAGSNFNRPNRRRDGRGNSPAGSAFVAPRRWGIGG